MLPEKLSYGDRFKLARDVGSKSCQAPTEPDVAKAEEIKKAADSASIRIDSVIDIDHWKYSLSSPTVPRWKRVWRECGLLYTMPSFGGADVVLLVPAVVDAKTSYHDAWARSQKEIRTLIPLRGRTQGSHRDRGGLEQVPAQPSRDGKVHR